jgi:hypothetical protein
MTFAAFITGGIMLLYGDADGNFKNWLSTTLR